VKGESNIGRGQGGLGMKQGPGVLGKQERPLEGEEEAWVGKDEPCFLGGLWGVA
jgi:hypothetical protein